LRVESLGFRVVGRSTNPSSVCAQERDFHWFADSCLKAKRLVNREREEEEEAIA